MYQKWAMGFVVLFYSWHGNKVQAERIGRGTWIFLSIFLKQSVQLAFLIDFWILHSRVTNLYALFFFLSEQKSCMARSIFSTWKENLLYTLTVTNKECFSAQLHLVVLSWQKESYRMLFDNSMTFSTKLNVKFCLESPCTLSIMNYPLQVLHK